MPDEQDRNVTDLTSRDAGLPATAHRSEGHLDLLDMRIADPKTPLQESIMLTRLRGEIISQDESRLDRDNARRMEIRQFWGKLVFSIGAVGTGLGLIATGFSLEGFVTLGIGFHWLAPDFVKGMYDRILGTKEKNDAE